MRCSLLLAGLLSFGCASGMAPAPAPKVKPGKVAVSKPHQDGLVTKLRPFVTTLHADDPFSIALHWATEKGPIPAYKDNRPFARFATLRTMTFVLTSPDRKKHELKVDVPPPQGNDDWNGGLYYAPTYLFTIAKDGLAYQQHPQPARKFPWADKATVDITQPGVWKVGIRGTITDGKVAGTAFESSEIELEVGAEGIRSQKAIQEIAATALTKKEGPKAVKEPVLVREDKDGNRVVVFRGALGMKWSFTEYAVTVKPNGEMGAITSREVSTCLARGTLIDTERGSKAIEALRPGDRIWGWSSESQQRVLTTVRVIRQGEAMQTLLFGTGLRVTANHPIWAGGVWKPAGEVKPDDVLLDSKSREVKAGQAKVISDRVEVYDLTVDAPHCYFAGGLLVHNKDRAYWSKVDDPWYSLWPE